MPDIRDLNRRAVDYSVEIVAAMKPTDLDRPTPCSAWTFGELLAHMTVQHRGFAAAARGHGADEAVWEAGPLADDPAAAYAAAAADVVAAYAEPGVLERDFALPEFGPGVTVPGSQAIGFHFIDYVVHGWDAARALGIPYHLDDDLAGPALEIALAVPDTEQREQPGSPFARALPTPDSSPALDRILRALGRSPSWPN
ncbi:TIGR03086 family metal-binding protein [Nocardia blacklockiae]|uniref:TIGR03086 family metal-binding protein n=1 Tax=Nocardia blacklockiae TaxID=480036 RepID=UPI00189354DD|nr:TIGR03086 family metal-binding protein [Nocardia blacklockiae]MBF6172130.1 TIGR03086 family protein [Nocardia blacklockiae]